MTGHPFGVWLDSDRIGPVPEPVPPAADTTGQYWLSADGEVIHLWCNLCTAGGEDYLAEWATPEEYEAELSARVRAHQAEKHTDTTTPPVTAAHEPWCCRSPESPCAKAGGCSGGCNCEKGA